MINDVEHFMYMLAVHKSSFWKNLYSNTFPNNLYSNPLPNFVIELLGFFVVVVVGGGGAAI